MLDGTDFLDWCMRHSFTEQACATIAKVRSSAPTRRVGGGRQNVSGRYPSRKMGTTIQFESHRVELPFVYEMEHDSGVLEYYDQPPSIPLVYQAANGRRLSVMHTPDYFVLHDDSAGWEECKTAEDLEGSRSRVQTAILATSAASGAAPPGGIRRDIGLGLPRVFLRPRSTGFSSEICSFWRTICDLTLRSPARYVDPAIIGAVETEPGIPLLNLLERTGGVAKPDEIYLLIANGEIYVDLAVARSSSPNKFASLLLRKPLPPASLSVARACAGIGVRSIDGRLCESPDVHSEAFLLLMRRAKRILPLRTGASNCQATSRRGQAVALHSGQNIASLDGAV